MIAPEYLATLRRQYRPEMVLVLVQLEQITPDWWLTLEELAEQLGTDRSTLNRSIRKLERLGLLKRSSYSNCGGTWIWWVKRSATDQPSPDAEPAWVARDVKRGLKERITISGRWQWAAKHGIPKGTMSSWLYGYMRLLRERWVILETPHMTEQRIQQQIRLSCGTGDTRLFRNNTGVLRDYHGRPVSFGLAKGSADLIGWTTRTITPEMVGQRVAVFTSIEVKAATGRLRPEQRQWLTAVQAAGGIAGVARSVEEAEQLLTAHPDGVPGAAQQQQPEQP